MEHPPPLNITTGIRGTIHKTSANLHERKFPNIIFKVTEHISLNNIKYLTYIVLNKSNNHNHVYTYCENALNHLPHTFLYGNVTKMANGSSFPLWVANVVFSLLLEHTHTKISISALECQMWQFDLNYEVVGH